MGVEIISFQSALIDGDDLSLSTESPIESGGKKVNPHLRWKRAKAN